MWSQHGCNAYDTTLVNLMNFDANLTAVLVNTNLIRFGATENDSLHFKVQTDTLIMGSLSIPENHIKNDIRLFPNPVTTHLNFTLNESPNSFNLEIFDSSGKKVKTKNFPNNSNEEFNGTVDISTLKNGLYFCKFSNGETR